MKRIRERLIRYLLTILAFSSLVFLIGIIVVLFTEALPIFRKVTVLEFLFGRTWYPTGEPADFGILPLIIGSFWVTLGAMAVCVPLGVGSALYLNELAGTRQKAVLKPAIEVLAGVPSIVYGFFGMVVIAPFMQDLLNLPIGLCSFTASLILGLMATPTVASVAEDALGYVPRSFREASFALGADRWQTLTKVVIPAAGSGLSTAIILGMSRAIGETMAVLMVGGNAPVMPKGLGSMVRTLTMNIITDMSYATGDHLTSLFATGIVLFAFILILNLAVQVFLKRSISEIEGAAGA